MSQSSFQPYSQIAEIAEAYSLDAPWSQVHKWLMNGPEDNVWHYYRVVAGNLGESAIQLEQLGQNAIREDNTAQRPWWKIW
jgi:hypothetical protein